MTIKNLIINNMHIINEMHIKKKHTIIKYILIRM